MKHRSLLCSLLAVVLSGCGYTFQGSGSVLPSDVTKIYIPLVENISTEPGLSTLMTEALQDQFERYGVITVVENLSDADAVLKTQIKKVKKNTKNTTSGTDSALQYETQLVIGAELRRVTGPVLWRNANLSVSKSYGSTSGSVVSSSVDFSGGNINSGDLNNLDSLQIERGQESEALEQLAEDAARQVYDQAVTPDF